MSSAYEDDLFGLFEEEEQEGAQIRELDKPLVRELKMYQEEDHGVVSDCKPVMYSACEDDLFGLFK
jgi:hypothetical protein